MNKIIIASGIFPPDLGGPATYAEKVSHELHKRNFKVIVITYGNKKTKIKDYPFPVVVISRKFSAGIRHILYFLNILKVLKSFDVIYAQNVTSAGLPSFFAAKILRKKFILKIVGDAAWERALGEGITNDNIDIFQSKQYNLKTEILRKVQRYVAKNAYRVIVPSFFLKDIVTGWGVTKSKSYVVYNAVEYLPGVVNDLPKAEAKGKIGIDGDIILSIGRLTPWKGFCELIDIIPNILTQNPKFRLIIVGSGPLEEDLRRRIKYLRLDKFVRLVGAIEREEIPLYLKAADIFVLNSRYEGLSHVILEAMAAGTPIIATRVGGNAELLDNNNNGFLVDPYADKELQAKILELWGDSGLQNKFIVNSREKLKNFNFDKMMSDTLRILLS